MEEERVSFPNQNQMLSNQQSPNVPSQNSKRKIVLFAIIIIILLVFFFGILKYYTWISPQNSPLQPSPESTPRDSMSTKFPALDSTEEAKETFTELLPSILLSSLIPSKDNVLIKKDQLEKNSFTAEWHQEQTTVFAHFALSSEKGKKKYLILNVSYPQIINPRAEEALVATTKYLSIKLEGQWLCRENECDNFWIGTDEIKRGANISTQLDIGDNKKGTVITFCEYTKETPMYKYVSNSCFAR